MGNRFELEQLAGSGAMGRVFRALDRATGEAVAVKVLLDGGEAAEARFRREGDALRELRHPGLVQYVAHGVASSGHLYLAMEWLDGEDLSHRLERDRLTVEETVELAARVAETLSVVHACRMVHRDLKPSNLFLVDHAIERVKVIDFGIAQLGDRTAMTPTGTLLGTFGYMAPEQARGDRTLDASGDIFSLGCVLFKCLTAKAAFVGENVMALMGKILFEEVPRVVTLRPEVPDWLDDLISRMLAKDPVQRPRDGTALAMAIGARTTEALVASSVTRGAGEAPVAMSQGERRLLSVVLVGRDKDLQCEKTLTLAAPVEECPSEELKQAMETRGGRLEFLTDGSMIVTIAGTRGSANDQAANAARCALALRSRVGERPMALATGRGEVTGKIPLGEAIDRAARLVAASAARWGPASRELHASRILIDEVTAGLLDTRFELAGEAGERELLAEREAAEGVRVLLGKPSPCVGRDRELEALLSLFKECVEESLSRAVLLTAPAGIGKSRVAYELRRLIRQQHESAEIWLGQTDSLRAGSVFGLLGHALRRACQILDGEPLEVRQHKLRSRVARHVPAGEQQRVGEFLGELIGVPLSDKESAPLRAARHDTRLMGEQMSCAWQDLLRAECAAHPIVLVLEDLHWGDWTTVRFIDAALRDLKDQPWMVLALARPEVHDLFPRLWADRRMQEMRLEQLTQRASERLVSFVLGESVRPETVVRLAALSDGNAFYLEELIRAVAEGKGASLPETVLAMVQSRLEGVEGAARQILRAASVFGETFWMGGIAVLLGGAKHSNQASVWLRTLVEREALVHRPESRFPGEQEFAFRHALIREGAYAMLTERDRELGHKLAATWLEAMGESNPLVLAEHFERGREPVRAGHYYLRAAEQAQQGNDVDAVISHAERGLSCGVSGELRIALLSVACEAHLWRKRQNEELPHAEELMRLAEPGSMPWIVAGRAQLLAVMRGGPLDAYVATVRSMLTINPSPDIIGPIAYGLATAVICLDLLGQFDFADTAFCRLHTIVEQATVFNPFTFGVLNIVHAHREALVKEEPWSGLRCAETALASFIKISHQQLTVVTKLVLAMNLWLLGAFEKAERELRDTMTVADRALGTYASSRHLFLVGTLLDRGATEEAHQEVKRMSEDQESIFPHDKGRRCWAAAEVLRRQRDLDAAEREAVAAVKLLATVLQEQVPAMATLAAVQLAQGRASQALATIQAALAKRGTQTSFGLKGALARLVYAEALHAIGDHVGARAAIATARDRLHTQAACIDDPAMQQCFLERVPENARTLDLSRQWLVEDDLACESEA